MWNHRVLIRLAAIALSVSAPVLAHAAAQLKAKAATSAQPTAPVGSALRQLQIQFDPATLVTLTGPAQLPVDQIDPTRAVSAFQLTVGYDSSLVTLQTTGAPDYTNTNFRAPTREFPPFVSPLIGPYSTAIPIVGDPLAPVSANALPPGFDTFVTASGTVTKLVIGDVNIFSLLWNLAPGVTDAALVPFIIFASDHTSDSTGLPPDYIQSVDFGTGTDVATNAPGFVETTEILVSRNGVFQTVAGNTALTTAVPLPNGAAAGLLGLVVAGLCGLGYQRGQRQMHLRGA